MDIKEILCDDKQTVIECLNDYSHMLQVGLSVAYPLLGKRAQMIVAVADIIEKLTAGEGDDNGRTTENPSGHDNSTGRADEDRNVVSGPGLIHRGHSESGPDTADWSNPTERREVPSEMGREEDTSAPDGGLEDDSGDGPHGE